MFEVDNGFIIAVVLTIIGIGVAHTLKLIYKKESVISEGIMEMKIKRLTTGESYYRCDVCVDEMSSVEIEMELNDVHLCDECKDKLIKELV
ncbi:hypothetical protein [Priestia aryabhattai]|uniref:hypothetical protein n=1 Tax=Priestia aryabhattai TaxID=412384 RepID=UPI0015F6B3A4|nr:hypothetical protein [Priestia aryabhattai]